MRVTRLSLLVLSLLGVVACATLAPRLQGDADPLAWRAEDLETARRTFGGRDVWTYSFDLVITETRGTALALSEIETMVYQPGTQPWSARYRGAWALPARGVVRIPLSSSLSCIGTAPNCEGRNTPIPLWRLVLSGEDDTGRPVRSVIDVQLPGDPPALVTRRAEGIPALDLRAGTPATTPRRSPSPIEPEPRPAAGPAPALTSYYRMPQPPTADGSLTADVLQGYFALTTTPYRVAATSYLPYAYTEFNPHTDERIVFILHVNKPSTDATLSLALRSPNGSVHESFTRPLPARVAGSSPVHVLVHEFEMNSLRAWQGWWELEVLRNETPLGRYRFLLADSNMVRQYRKR